MNTTHNTTEMHAVFATDGDHNTFRVSDPLSWDEAQREWNRLDALHREGRLPQAKFFEVRSVTVGPDRPLVGPVISSHGRYDGAELNMLMTKPVLAGSRGYADAEWFQGRRSLDYSGAEKAARKAWRLFASEVRQGEGGWFYWPNGRAAAQGLRDLANVCKKKCLIVKGVNGRWFVVDYYSESN